jgi:heat-inducible transcriptional repressor
MQVSQRARRILFALVNEYIETGAPVGSRTLSKRYGLDLSAASIRNELSDLDEAGFLTQPHTSAGRVPTDLAIRFFINALMEVRAVPPDDRARLRERVADIYRVGGDPLRASGKLLSELSGKAAVVARRSPGRTLSQMRFIPTRPGQLLAVIVFQDGSVENRFITVEGHIDEAELTRVHNLLAEVIEGHTLAEVRELFARRLDDGRSQVDDPRGRAFQLADRAIADVASQSELVIEGQSRLIGLPEYEDVDRLKRLLMALEEREEIVALLDKVLEAGAVTVFVGSETEELAGGELSLVVAPYAENGHPAGAVGVIGPTRMDYAKVIPVVDATAAAMTDALASASAARRND